MGARHGRLVMPLCIERVGRTLNAVTADLRRENGFMRKFLLIAASCASQLALGAGAGAQRAAAPSPGSIDVTIPSTPTGNFDKADFRLWVPPSVSHVKVVVVLVPGSNGDGRGSVDDTLWRSFAEHHDAALIGCHLTDKQHDRVSSKST